LQNFRDYYEILGVPREATNEEIKQVFRRLAHSIIPISTGKQTEEKLKILARLEVLSDPSKRAHMTSSANLKQRGFQRQTTPRAKTWENRSSSSRIGTEEVDFSPFVNSFVEQVLGRRQESGVPSRQARAMCLVVLAQRKRHTISSRASRRI